MFGKDVKPGWTLVKILMLGWFGFCYLTSLVLIPVFPFVTTGFNLQIALMIIFVSPFLFALQGLLIGVIVSLGLSFIGTVARCFKFESRLNRFVGE